MSLIALLFLFGTLAILGLVNICFEIKRIRTQVDYVGRFVTKVDELNRTLSTQEDPTDAISYILANYNEVSNVIGEDASNMPVHRLGTALSYFHSVDPRLLIQIVAERVEFEGKKERQVSSVKRQLWNPFIWLYRGVEFVMGIVFGYIIHKFDPKFNPESNTAWKIINTVVAFVGSLFSIISYFKAR